MKKLILFSFMVFGALSLYAKDIKQMVVTTSPKMSCENCENKIKGNLRFEKGVKKVETSLADQTVIVTYDADKTDEEKIAKAFEKLNYKVSKTTSECSEEKSSCSGCKK